MVRWPLGQGARLLGRLGPRDLLELGRLVIQGGSAIADRFASEARAFLVGPGMHSDLQPEVPGSGAYALIMHPAGRAVGMPVAQGGSGAVSAVLAAAVRDAGSVILTGRPVDQIVVEAGRVVGVEAGGDRFSARRAVIAALDPRTVIRGPGRMRSRPAASPRSGGTVVDLASSRSTGRWTGRYRGWPRNAGGLAWFMSATRSGP
jgi:phytoene dehydrogenase-like protein